MPIRVVVADDNYLIREGVRRLLELQPDLETVAVCGDLDSLLAAVARENPDVVVTDIRMPPTGLDEGIQAAQLLRESHPSTGVVVLSQHADPTYAIELFEQGTAGRGYLLKERVDDIEQLVGAIRTVAAGGSVVDPAIVDTLVSARLRPGSSPLDDLTGSSPLDELTPRERDVLREIAEGKSNAAVAATLFITERAVEKVSHSIFSKLDLSFEDNVNRRVKAVLLYLSEQPVADSRRP
jgi:DNA-binding NarL/FixJ family response regulator